MKIIAKIDCNINGKYYEKGKEISNLTYSQIVKLNEIGFIEPLDYKQLMAVKEELEQPKIIKKEDK